MRKKYVKIQMKYAKKEQKKIKRHFGVSFLIFRYIVQGFKSPRHMWSISSTADVQGRALCPGSTPGASLSNRKVR